MVLVVVCSATREVVSVGIDRRVAIHRTKPSGIGLVLAGGIDEAHKTSISACAVSQEAQLIATAAGGEIRLWHKQVSLEAPLTVGNAKFPEPNLPALAEMRAPGGEAGRGNPQGRVHQV